MNRKSNPGSLAETASTKRGTAAERHYNRPGLSTLAYRSSKYATTLIRMLERLPKQNIPPGEYFGSRPLHGLSTQAMDDPAIALLDSWAIVHDILTFYQERIANEGYLNTAIERRSIHALTRSIGYELDPGVAAGTQLAFTVETAPGSPATVKVPTRTQVMSVPGQDEFPQTFETLKDLEARAAWNALLPVRMVEESIAPVNIGLTQLWLQDPLEQVKPGHFLMLVGPDRKSYPGSERWEFRQLTTVERSSGKKATLVTWEDGLGYNRRKHNVLPPEQPDVFIYQQKSNMFGYNAPKWRETADEIRRPALRKKYALPGEPNGVACLAVSPDSLRIASGCNDGFIKIWIASSGRQIKKIDTCPGTKFDPREAPITALAYLPGGAQLVALGHDKTITVRKTSNWNILAEHDSKRGALTCVAVGVMGITTRNPAEHGLVVTGDDQGLIQFYKFDRDAGELTALKGTLDAGARLNALAISPDSKLLAAGTETGQVRLWNLVKQKAVTVSNAKHKEAVMGMAFCQMDQKLELYSVGLDHTIKRGTISLANTVYAYQNIEVIKGEELQEEGLQGFTCIDLHPQAKGPPLILTGGKDHIARLWKYFQPKGTTEKKWRPIRYYMEHTAPVTCVAFAPDGRKIYCGSSDALITQWETGDHQEPTGNPGRKIHSLAGHPLTDRYKHWPDLAIDKSRNWIELVGTYPGIGIDHWIVIRKAAFVELYRIKTIATAPKEDFTFSETVTHLTLDTNEHLSWFHPRKAEVYVLGIDATRAHVKQLVIPPIKGDRLELNQLAVGLKSRQIIMITGRRARLQIMVEKLFCLPDTPGEQDTLYCGETVIALGYPADDDEDGQTWHIKTPRGVVGRLSTAVGDVHQVASKPDDELVTEVAIIKSCTHGRRTTLTLTSAVKNIFDPATVSINANVVEASHGQTAKEILGSGNANRANQSFELRKPPLTYISTSGATGKRSTLQLFVDDVKWEETPSLFGTDAAARKYMMRQNNLGKSAVIFGDGDQGTRLPTGVENIKAVYRHGIGPDGEVPAGSLTLLPRRPLGIKGVINPVEATGGAAPETKANAKDQAPRTVLTLGRIVSRQDFEDFTRTFPGIGKAQAATFGFGENRLLHITIASQSGKEVPKSSPVYLNLLTAINRYRGSLVELQVDSLILCWFGISAQVQMDPAYTWLLVEDAIKKELLAAFSFGQRELGQGVSEAEVISVIAGVPGVTALTLTVLEFSDRSEDRAGEENQDFQLIANMAHVDDAEIVPGKLLLIDSEKIELVQKDLGNG